MIITISGKAGSGKSTVAKLIAKDLGLKHFSIGDLQRDLAKERGISILELSKLEESDESIDLELDNKQKKLGIQESDFVIDGRLSALFIPHADLKVFLIADESIRAKRILDDKRKGEQGKDIKEMVKNMRSRELSENRRYSKFYNYDCYDLDNFDISIDTTRLTPKEVVDKIKENINANKTKNEKDSNRNLYK